MKRKNRGGVCSLQTSGKAIGEFGPRKEKTRARQKQRILEENQKRVTSTLKKNQKGAVSGKEKGETGTYEERGVPGKQKKIQKN